MRYCKKCLYPENAKPTIIFDENGICSGCNYIDSRKNLEIDWSERQDILKEITDKAKFEAKKRGNSHDCIIPVGGGKDSHFQVWVLKKQFGMNPLLVTYNHGFNTPAGNWNLRNLVEKSGCDIIRFSTGLDSAKKLSRYMLEKVGDLTWHYHAGIRTFPFQIAVKYNIPDVFLGEHGFAELTGMVSMDDFVEHTRWSRKEHDMRGFEPEELIGKNNITLNDISPFIYPDDEDIERVNVTGHYLSNFFNWEGKYQAETVIEEWGFQPVTYERERTFFQYAKIEDHANDIHDYLKYLKFGYGRATDDASMEIRHGRMSRSEGLRLVRHYDSKTPSTLPFYCEFLGISVEDFYRLIEPFRDEKIWEKDYKGKWSVKDSVWTNQESASVNDNSSTLNGYTFSDANSHLYFNPNNPPQKTGINEIDKYPEKFAVI